MAISLKAARVNAGLTQAQAAEKLNISKSTMQNYEKYKTTPNIEKSKQIAALYNMSVDSIIFFVE